MNRPKIIILFRLGNSRRRRKQKEMFLKKITTGIKKILGKNPVSVWLNLYVSVFLNLLLYLNLWLLFWKSFSLKKHEIYFLNILSSKLSAEWWQGERIGFRVKEGKGGLPAEDHWGQGCLWPACSFRKDEAGSQGFGKYNSKGKCRVGIPHFLRGFKTETSKWKKKLQISFYCHTGKIESIAPVK